MELVPGGHWDNPDDWAYPFNTGADDREILVEVETVGSPESGTSARSKVPNPLAAAPTLHAVAATTMRDLDIIDEDSADLIVKVDMTVCPINTGTGEADCFVVGPTECGDGVLDPGEEECDDGNDIACDGCSPTCDVELGLVCGDGILNEHCGEECDDGNTRPDDGCDGDCNIELPLAISGEYDIDITVVVDTCNFGTKDSDAPMLVSEMVRSISTVEMPAPTAASVKATSTASITVNRPAESRLKMPIIITAAKRSRRRKMAKAIATRKVKRTTSIRASMACPPPRRASAAGRPGGRSWPGRGPLPAR